MSDFFPDVRSNLTLPYRWSCEQVSDEQMATSMDFMVILVALSIAFYVLTSNVLTYFRHIRMLMGHLQKVQIQIRRCKGLRFIRTSTNCHGENDFEDIKSKVRNDSLYALFLNTGKP